MRSQLQDYWMVSLFVSMLERSLFVAFDLATTKDRRREAIPMENDLVCC